MAEHRDRHEIEVKLRCTIRQLEDCGVQLTLEQARHFEDNWLFDTPDRQLLARGAVLRVRTVRDETGESGLLTLKEKAPPDAPASQFKLRLETETSLDAPTQAMEILQRLGYEKSFRYQKYRTVYRAVLSDGHNVHVMADETPLGDFLELEGAETAIAQVVAKLGVTPADYILQSYIALQDEYCEEQGRPLEDMIFR